MEDLNLIGAMKRNLKKYEKAVAEGRIADARYLYERLTSTHEKIINKMMESQGMEPVYQFC